MFLFGLGGHPLKGNCSLAFLAYLVEKYRSVSLDLKIISDGTKYSIILWCLTFNLRLVGSWTLGWLQTSSAKAKAWSRNSWRTSPKLRPRSRWPLAPALAGWSATSPWSSERPRPRPSAAASCFFRSAVIHVSIQFEVQFHFPDLKFCSSFWWRHFNSCEARIKEKLISSDKHYQTPQLLQLKRFYSFILNYSVKEKIVSHPMTMDWGQVVIQPSSECWIAGQSQMILEILLVTSPLGSLL